MDVIEMAFEAKLHKWCMDGSTEYLKRFASLLTAEKDAEIERLTQLNDEKRGDIAHLENDIAVRDARIDELEREAIEWSDQATQIVCQYKQIEEQKSRIAELEAERDKLLTLRGEA